MKNTHTIIATSLISLLAFTGCGEEEPTPPQENIAVVSPGNGETVEIPITIEDPARVKNTENVNLLNFEITKIEKNAPCTPVLNTAQKPEGVPTKVTFTIFHYQGYSELAPEYVYNPMGWDFEYADGSENSGMTWAALRCVETNSEVGSTDQDVTDGTATLILPNADGTLIYNDHRTGAKFELPVSKAN